jgi:Cd2+/Zn2+-exporting ATPase
MNILSLIGLVVGFVIHVVRDNATEAFGGEVGEEETERPDYPPITSIITYSISFVAGSWFIFPKAIKSIRRLRPDPNLLMTIAALGAIVINHWFEATSSMYLFSVAGIVETWNVSRSRKAIR